MIYLNLDSILRALWPESEATGRPLADLVTSRLLQLARKGQLKGWKAGTEVPVTTDDLSKCQIVYYTTNGRHRKVPGQVNNNVKKAFSEA